MLPLKPDFSGTTYVPTSSSTRRVNSCIRGTCKAHHFHDKSLHGFPHIKAGSFIQSMKHFFALIYLFCFCFCFILFFYYIFEFLIDLN